MYNLNKAIKDGAYLMLKYFCTVYDYAGKADLSNGYGNQKKKIEVTMHFSGLEITAGQRTMSGLIWELTGQPFVLPVMLTGHI